MLDIILNFLISYYPQIAIYAIVILATGFLVFKVTKFCSDTNKVCKNDFPAMAITLKSIESGFDKLNSILMEKNVINTSCYSQSHSPRVLNLSGKKLYIESGAEKLLNSLLDSLLSELETMSFDSPLEVERACLKLFIQKMENPEFNEVQTFAYNHPSFEDTPLAYSDILFVMALMLRDKYFEKHPELLKKK
jgi:hypothetical protein